MRENFHVAYESGLLQRAYEEMDDAVKMFDSAMTNLFDQARLDKFDEAINKLEKGIKITSENMNVGMGMYMGLGKGKGKGGRGMDMESRERYTEFNENLSKKVNARLDMLMDRAELVKIMVRSCFLSCVRYRDVTSLQTKQTNNRMLKLKRVICTTMITMKNDMITILNNSVTST